MAGGPLQAADDIARIVANSMTFGAADKFAAAMGEKNTAARTKAAQDRAGIAGDAASLLGYGGDLKLAGKALKAVPAIAGAVMSRKGLAALGLGLGSLAEYNARTSADAAPAPAKAAAAKPAAAAQPAAKAAPDATAATAAPSPFDAMVQRLAAGQNGMISLRQLSALSDAAQRGQQANYYANGGSARPPAPGDAAGHMLEQMYVGQFQKALQDPKADPVKAQQEFENKVLQLRKTQFIDPYGLHDGEQ